MSRSNTFYICQAGKKADLYNTETTVAVRAHTHIIRRTNGRGHFRRVAIDLVQAANVRLDVLTLSSAPPCLEIYHYSSLSPRVWVQAQGRYLTWKWICIYANYVPIKACIYTKEKSQTYGWTTRHSGGKHQNWNVSTERQQDVQ